MSNSKKAKKLFRDNTIKLSNKKTEEAKKEKNPLTIAIGDVNKILNNMMSVETNMNQLTMLRRFKENLVVKLTSDETHFSKGNYTFYVNEVNLKKNERMMCSVYAYEFAKSVSNDERDMVNLTNAYNSCFVNSPRIYWTDDKNTFMNRYF